MSTAQELAGDAAPARTGPRRSSSVVWAAVACSLLGATGVVRESMDRIHGQERNFVEKCPVDLRELPTKLGSWEMIDGGEKSLDPLTMRISGGTDHLIRTYKDTLTGLPIMVLILFGPAEPVIPHTPEICYPSNGYSPADEPLMRIVKGGDGRDYPCRAGIYSKTEGRTTMREESYHTFRLEGVWSPDAGMGRKFPRKNPSVFKVQAQRRVLEGESREIDVPTEQLLRLLLPELERLIVRAEGGTGPSSKATSRH